MTTILAVLAVVASGSVIATAAWKVLDRPTTQTTETTGWKWWMY